MDKARKMELLRRSLGLRHKLKVLESGKMPETHEDIAVSLIAKWELEDELRAIEEILADARQTNTATKRKQIEGQTDSSDKLESAAKKRKAKGV
jgi:hypothetical protein